MGLGLFHGFSKMLIALGLEPDDMDTTVLPTPERLGHEPAPTAAADRHVDLLGERPDLAARWSDMAAKLAALESIPAPALQSARARLAQLYGVDWAAAGPTDGNADDLNALAIECAELFAIDVRAITSDHLRRVRALTDDGGVVQLIMTLAVYDGIYRFAATVPEGPTPKPARA